jgi:serine/threonine protein kinase
MHRAGIIHRDLKSANILMCGKDGSQVKIGDLGLSRTLRQPIQKKLTKEIQSLWYRAPEVLLSNRNYTYATDYWSVGVIAYEMIYLEHRYPGNCEIDMLFRIFKEKGTPSF